MRLGHAWTDRSYSAKPDYAWGACGGHFPKWPLSQKLRGAEPSTLTVYVGFVRRRFQKKYCEMYHTTLSDIVKAILQNGGHFKSNTSISETKRRRAFNVDSMCSFILRITSRITQSCPADPIFRVRFSTLEKCPFFDVIFRSPMRPPSLSSFFQDCFGGEGASPDVSEPLQFLFMNFVNQLS